MKRKKKSPSRSPRAQDRTRTVPNAEERAEAARRPPIGADGSHPSNTPDIADERFRGTRENGLPRVTLGGVQPEPQPTTNWAAYKRAQRAADLEELKRRLGSEQLAKVAYAEHRAAEKRRERAFQFTPYVYVGSGAAPYRIGIGGQEPLKLRRIRSRRSLSGHSTEVFDILHAALLAMRLSSLGVSLKNFSHIELQGYVYVSCKHVEMFINAALESPDASTRRIARNVACQLHEIQAVLFRSPMQAILWFAGLLVAPAMLIARKVPPKPGWGLDFGGLGAADGRWHDHDLSSCIDRYTEPYVGLFKNHCELVLLHLGLSRIAGKEQAAWFEYAQRTVQSFLKGGRITWESHDFTFEERAQSHQALRSYFGHLGDIVEPLLKGAVVPNWWPTLVRGVDDDPELRDAASRPFTRRVSEGRANEEGRGGEFG